MSVQKRNNGYTVRWRDSSGRQRSQQVTLYRDAVALDADIKRRQRMGELITHERGEQRLVDFWPLWVQRYGSIHIAPRTLATYTVLWNKHVVPNVGYDRLREINAESVSALIAKLSRTLAPASIRKVVAVLQGVLTRAVEWGFIATNPAEKVRKPKVRSREGIALTWEQVHALVAEVDWRSGSIVYVLADSGLRPGELRALTWRDVRGENLLVTKAVSLSQITDTKTEHKRSVVKRLQAQMTLREWELGQGRPRDTALVFPSVNGRGIWTDEGWRNWQRKVFTPAAKRAGFEGLVPYDLRHTFVSTLIAEGRDVYWIARQAGHSPTMTLNTYGHLFEHHYGEASAPGVRRDLATSLNP